MRYVASGSNSDCTLVVDRDEATLDNEAGSPTLNAAAPGPKTRGTYANKPY